MKKLIKRMLRPAVRHLYDLLKEVESERMPSPPAVPCDNTYAWLRYAFAQLAQNPDCVRKPMYTWGVLQGAALAHVLRIPRISVIEFGVAGGSGLLALQRIAIEAGALAGVGIDVYGFDSGLGMPRPTDYRDQPNMWFEGQLPMDPVALRKRLTHARLELGPVRDTVPAFLERRPAPIAFVSFDLDLYSSTRQALGAFEGALDRVLPRVPCYFDDILGHSYSEFTGERLAIREFNSQARRKLAPIYGLRYFVPEPWQQSHFWDGMFWAHFLDHRQYNELDSVQKAVYTDDQGRDYRDDVTSDWRSRLPVRANDRYA